MSVALAKLLCPRHIDGVCQHPRNYMAGVCQQEVSLSLVLLSVTQRSRCEASIDKIAPENSDRCCSSRNGSTMGEAPRPLPKKQKIRCHLRNGIIGIAVAGVCLDEKRFKDSNEVHYCHLIERQTVGMYREGGERKGSKEKGVVPRSLFVPDRSLHHETIRLRFGVKDTNGECFVSTSLAKGYLPRLPTFVGSSLHNNMLSR